jgi:hypothetical protein
VQAVSTRRVIEVVAERERGWTCEFSFIRGERVVETKFIIKCSI